MTDYEPLITAAAALLRASPHIGAAEAMRQAIRTDVHLRNLHTYPHPNDRIRLHNAIRDRAGVPALGTRVQVTHPDYAGECGTVWDWDDRGRAVVYLDRGGEPSFDLSDLEVL